MTNLFSFLPSVGVPELLIVLAIAILILGPKQIPKAGRSLGRGLRNFRHSVSGKGDDAEKALEGPDAAGPDATVETADTSPVAEEGKAES